MRYSLFLGLMLAIRAGDVTAQAPPPIIRTDHFGPLVTTTLQPVDPGPRPAPNAPYEPVPAKLSGLKWQGSSWFTDSQGRRWRRLGGLPMYPLPLELTGWQLPLNDGRLGFYSNNGQLFMMCLP